MSDISEVDLVSRAALAIRCLTSMTDPVNDGPPYFLLSFDKQPAEAWHMCYDYGDGLGRYSDALPLMRVMTGSRLNLDVQEDLWRRLLATIGKDGLSWIPPEPELAGEGVPSYAEIGWSQRGMLLAFITHHLISGEREHGQRIERLIDTLLRIGMGDDSFIYFPRREYHHGGWQTSAAPCDPALLPAEGIECWTATVVGPASLWYRMTGYPPAADLVRRAVQFIREKTDVFAPDGTFKAGCRKTTHFHSRSSVALAALRFGLDTDDSDMVDWACGTYRSGLEMGSDFGFFPERINTARHCETCCITDMLEMAILLARHRDARYWADAERFGKNQLLANQITAVDWLDRVPDRKANEPSRHPSSARGDSLLATRLGGFLIAPLVNDMVDAHHPDYYGIGNCCHGAGARALYDLWHYAVEELPAEVRVHMHFSRKTPSVDVRCLEGENGRIEIRSHGAKRMAVRIPEFSPVAAIRAEIDGCPVDLRASNGYLYWDAPKPGQQLTLGFRNAPRVTEFHPLNESFRISWLGNRVVEVDPKGTVAPLYQGMPELPPSLVCTPPATTSMGSEIQTI